MLVAGIAPTIRAQTPQGTPMPYTAIHQPEFVAASEATFLQDDDILLGITSGNVAEGVPAGDPRSMARCSTRCRTVPFR